MSEHKSEVEYVKNLYARLDAYRKIRRELARWWMLWVLLLLFLLILSIPLAEGAFVVAVGLFTLFIGFTALLLWRTVQTSQTGTVLEREVEALKRREIIGAWADDEAGVHLAKPKRDDAVYTIGDDGELVEIDPFEENEPSRQQTNH